MKSKNKFINRSTFLIVIVIIISTFLYFHATQKLNTLTKCPEEYAENDIGTAEYREALSNWTSEFFKANPQATMSDWAIAKLKLWEDNNCVIAIERSKMSGNVADLKPWERVDYEVQNVIQNGTK